MHIKAFRVENFRRLRNVRVDLERDQTVFVGANNSGKTSATHLFQLFLGQQPRPPFQIYDFTADCWARFNAVDADPWTELPKITFDLWFDVDEDNLHRVLELLPSLDWNGEPVGVRMVYAPKNAIALIENYKEARAKAHATTAGASTSFRAWPQSMVDYLDKRLPQEYEIKYFSLNPARCDADLMLEEGYDPFFLGTHGSGASKIVDSIVRVDFLNAQRHLSDADSRGRSEDLSKRLSRFYARNLDKMDTDLDALGAIAESEDRLNDHFARVFGPTLDRLAEVGYPGVANPGLVVKASFNAYGILSSSARVHYALPSAGGAAAVEQMLPDQYNGLGFKNLIFMVVEVLDFHQAWSESQQDRPPIHLVMIEEPEAHLHAQLQQVFIRKILDIIPEVDPDFQTQLVVTTHSPHIVYESNFRPIRYFSRVVMTEGLQCSDVKNLSRFYDEEELATRDFLQQYIKLTHCDLFFADGAVLVEGNVERLLLPLVIERFVPALRSCHLTILEVGGAFAFKFEKLMTFLGLPTLVITDLDSVLARVPSAEGEAEEDDALSPGKACTVHTPGAVTSNATLKQWLPQISSIQELLDADNDLKVSGHGSAPSTPVRVSYQTRETVSWQGASEDRAGRTLEEAFALQNLDWTQGEEGKSLGLRIRGSSELSIEDLHDAIFKRVKGSHFDKTAFVLGVVASVMHEWKAPAYLTEGLEWLRDRLEPLVRGELAEQTSEDGER
ncbi:ATP-dependent endonuclease [Cellulomonas sp. PS-H5]|uniref:ATP-dependent nuclease n=1 Tax=Cellulomonas sp. PS-H5 TaxID=2820400 RepID=UPI001C4E7801|nr:ATP-dependent endonuclease [Cellulomonas sp. PS-H5]MBW0252467.1 ATP-dependent endonuclease [Cellulomonas sp. PS-H5]